MQLHGSAKTTPYAREMMVRRVLEQAKPVKDTAEELGVSRQTVYKWIRRYQEEGREGLVDRSSRPRRSPTRTSSAVVKKILELRRRVCPGKGTRGSVTYSGRLPSRLFLGNSR